MRPSNLRSHSLRRLCRAAPASTDVAEIAQALGDLEDRAAKGDEPATRKALDKVLDLLGEALG